MVIILIILIILVIATHVTTGQDWGISQRRHCTWLGTCLSLQKKTPGTIGAVADANTDDTSLASESKYSWKV